MKTLLSSISALVLLLVPEISAGASLPAGEAWMNVFVSETAGAQATRYDYVIQNKSDVAITAIEIGRKNACFGAPNLLAKSLGDKAQFLAPPGWTSSLKEGENGSVFVRFEGRSTDKRLGGFRIVGSNPLLSSGFICIYRADAKVWQCKAAVLKDALAPKISLSLSPATLESDTLFHEINATVTGSDDLDSQPQIKLSSIKSNRSDFDLTKEVKDAAFGTDDRKFQVLANKVGNYIVEYEISDAAGNTATASGVVSITAAVDKIAPTLTVELSPSSIAATNKLENIAANITMKDNIDKAPTVKLVAITSDAKDFVLSTDVKNAVLGSDDRAFQLKAERSDNVDRIYKITYEAKDAAGDKTTVIQTVTIKAEAKSALEKLLDAILELLKKLLALFK